MHENVKLTSGDPSKNVHPQTFSGPVVHVDRDSVYQIGGGGIAKHNVAIFVGAAQDRTVFPSVVQVRRGKRER